MIILYYIIMSFNTTIDDVVYQKTTGPENIAEKPFIKKEWTNAIYDTNTSSNYSSNQVIFETTSLSNSGSLIGYDEGFISLPFVIKVSKAGGTTDWTNAALGGTDFMIGFKNSHVQLINSFSITYGNIDIVQAVPLTNAYLTFIQHSEFSQEDEWLNGPLTGYSKDNSSSWYFKKPTLPGAPGSVNVLLGDSRGIGIGNNCNFKLVDGFDVNDTNNDGLLKRQKLVNKYNTEKLEILGTFDKQKTSAKSYVENKVDAKYIFYDVFIRLKDLCPNLFKNFPLTMGSKFKITLTLNNNVSFKFVKTAAGLFQMDLSKPLSNVSSATNPLMIAASYNSYQSQTGSEWEGASVNANVANTSGNYNFKLTDAKLNTTLVPCGSSCLPCDDAEYTVELKIGKIGLVSHEKQQCTLYVPSYKLNPKYEGQYFSPESRIKKVHYTELEYQNFETSGNFSKELSSSCVRPKRLIMIPFMTAAANEGLNPLSSPFASEPATTSPCVITNFNCSINNVNLFPNDVSYSYDHFIQQLNGQHGINANQVTGLVSSRINLVDFENNYHYLVVDLSRRLPEQDLISSSIKVRGNVASNKSIEFHCYIETEKIIEIDVMTGALLNRY